MLHPDIVKWLDSKAPIETQHQGMDTIRKEMANNDDAFDYSILILPEADRFAWDNCAVLISELHDDILIPLLYKLTPWLSFNTFGSNIIWYRLHQLSENVFFDYVLSLKKAYDDSSDPVCFEALAYMYCYAPPPGGHNLDCFPFLKEFEKFFVLE